RELIEVAALLRDHRLLTLTGIGGAGKTRLALQLAANDPGVFPDGTWFVDLASVRDADLVASEVATTLGFLPDGLLRSGETLEDRLCDQLRAKRLLLILDNCEHVVEPTARLVHQVLGRCPAVSALATSREILGLPGEAVWN